MSFTAKDCIKMYNASHKVRHFNSSTFLFKLTSFLVGGQPEKYFKQMHKTWPSELSF